MNMCEHVNVDEAGETGKNLNVGRSVEADCAYHLPLCVCPPPQVQNSRRQLVVHWMRPTAGFGVRDWTAFGP